MTHVPIVITCCYGQNQPIGTPQAELEQMRLWDSQCDYQHISYISVGIATDIKQVILLAQMVSMLIISSSLIFLI
jgi:hypothetical protein